MKKLLVASSLMLALCSSSYAWQQVPAGSSDGGFQGSSGARYQYDLNNGPDRDRYSIDLDAQRRDQMRVDIGRDQDRLRGQRGGGFLND